MIIVMIAEFLLYVSFSLLAGGLIFYIIPSSNWPVVNIPNRLIRICPLAITILSFAPLLPIIIGYADDIGLWQSIVTILFTFSLGWNWIFTVILSILLFCLLKFGHPEKNRPLAIIGLIIIIFLITVLSKSGHAAALAGSKGWISHTLHFLAVSLWIGPLQIVAWFSKGTSNWQAFTKWFTPFALICVTTIMVSGFITMQVGLNTYTPENPSTANQYLDSWMTNYGQALLIKHLLLIPLFAFAVISSCAIRWMVSRDTRYNPIRWIRLEAIIGVIIFSVTAYLGQQEPPHRIPGMITVFGPSPLFDVVYQGAIDPEMSLLLYFSWANYVLFFFAFISLLFIIIMAIRKASLIVTLAFALVLVVSTYLGLMLGVQTL